MFLRVRTPPNLVPARSPSPGWLAACANVGSSWAAKTNAVQGNANNQNRDTCSVWNAIRECYTWRACRYLFCVYLYIKTILHKNTCHMFVYMCDYVRSCNARFPFMDTRYPQKETTNQPVHLWESWKWNISKFNRKTLAPSNRREPLQWMELPCITFQKQLQNRAPCWDVPNYFKEAYWTYLDIDASHINRFGAVTLTANSRNPKDFPMKWWSPPGCHWMWLDIAICAKTRWLCKFHHGNHHFRGGSPNKLHKPLLLTATCAHIGGVLQVARIWPQTLSIVHIIVSESHEGL